MKIMNFSREFAYLYTDLMMLTITFFKAGGPLFFVVKIFMLQKKKESATNMDA